MSNRRSQTSASPAAGVEKNAQAEMEKGLVTSNKEEVDYRKDSLFNLNVESQTPNRQKHKTHNQSRNQDTNANASGKTADTKANISENTAVNLLLNQDMAQLDLTSQDISFEDVHHHIQQNLEDVVIKEALDKVCSVLCIPLSIHVYMYL